MHPRRARRAIPDALWSRAVAEHHDGADRHDRGDAQRRQGDREGRHRQVRSLSLDRARGGRDHAFQDGRRLRRARQSWPAQCADGDRLCAGPARQGGVARRHARLPRVQQPQVGRQADAALRHQGHPGDGRAHRVPGDAYAARRGQPRNRDHPQPARAAAVRQDRHHHRPEGRVVHRRHSANDRRRLCGL